jgi:hypothetical protein
LISAFPFTFTASLGETSDTRFEIVFLTCSQPVVFSQLSNTSVNSVGTGSHNWIVTNQTTGQIANFTTTGSLAYSFQLLQVPSSSITNLTYSNPSTPPPGKFFTFGASYLVQSYIGANLVSQCQYTIPTLIPQMSNCASGILLTTKNQDYILNIGAGNQYFSSFTGTYLGISSAGTTLLGIRYQIATDCNFSSSSIKGSLTKLYGPLVNMHVFNIQELLNAGIPLTAGTSYYVRVQAMNGHLDWMPYGNCCPFTISPSLVLRQSNLSLNSNNSLIKTYPNPFKTSFTLDLLETNQEKVTVKVYDMIGKLVEEKAIDTTVEKSVLLGDNYKTGIYNIVIQDGEEVKTQRVIKE